MKYNGVQCLRAVAALLVLLAHIKFVGNFGPNPLIASAAGACGVDVFFVISGFVIAISAERLHYDARRFYLTRLCRIVPFYWLMSLLVLVPDSLVFGFQPNARLNTLLFLPLLDQHTFHGVVLSFGWTMSFEFWFYTLVALLLLGLKQRALPAIAPLMLLLSLLVAFFYTGAWFLPHFLCHPFLLEFSAGVVLYQLRQGLGQRTAWAAAVGVLLFGWATWVHQDYGAGQRFELQWLYFRRDLVWGAFGLALVTLAVSLENLQAVRWPRWLVFLGDCSYSLYLIQEFALMAGIKASRMTEFGRPLSGAVVYVLCTLAGGALLSRWVEMPLTRRVRQWVMPKPALCLRPQ